MRTLLPIFLIACGELPEPPGAIAYETTIRPMLDRHCVGCHASEGQRFGGVELDSFDTAVAARKKIACSAIRQELVDEFALDLVRDTPLGSQTDFLEPCFGVEIFSMPPGVTGKLTTLEQDALVRWVVDGGPR